MSSGRAVRILNLGIVTNLESQSIYHAIADCMSVSSPDTIVLCIPRDPYFCIGFHQSSGQVISSHARAKYRYPVMRRRLGGGLTYLDQQQLFYQCIFHKRRSPSIPAIAFKAKLEAPIRTLRRIGLHAELLYTNEIEVTGKRIAGIGGGQIGEAHVVVGNILNDFDYQTMAEIVNAPCQIFHEFALKTMQKRITTLKQEGRSSDWAHLPDLLIEEYEKSVGVPTYLGELTSEERESSEQWAVRMTSRSYLDRYEEHQTLQRGPMTHLKISGSSSIRLFHYNRNLKAGYLVAVVYKGIVERMARVFDLYEEFSDSRFQTEIPHIPTSGLQVGTKLGLR